MSDYQDPGTPTHEPLDMDVVWDLSELIDEACPDGKVSYDKLSQIAHSESVPLSHVYAAAAFDPDYEWTLEFDRQVTVCLGACQGWGANKIAETLFELQAERRTSSQPNFDILAVGCLDRCTSPVAVDIDGAVGSNRLSVLRPGCERDILSALFD